MADPTPVPDIEQWSHELAGPLPRADTDAAAGFDILDSFERFNQRNDIFCRSFWDPTVRRDYSLRNAAWQAIPTHGEATSLTRADGVDATLQHFMKSA
jgi:hypothetical protein